jgi:hypothetical protein
MLCWFTLPTTYAQSGPEDHPAEKRKPDLTPDQVKPFFCRNGVREVITSDQSFELTDSWKGIVAIPRICGGCYFANAPGSSSPDPLNPITVSVYWADGSTDSADLTSDHLSVGVLTLSAQGLSATHTYNSVINPSKQATFKFSALCEDDQGQWREVIDNHCTYPNYYGCVPHSAAIGVYAPIPPSVASIARPVIHGQRAVGALAIVLQDVSPPSGETMTLTSSDKTVLFPQFGSPSTQSSTVLVQPNQSAQNFDIDATKAKAGTKFTITVKSTVAGGGLAVVTIPYTVQ